MKKNGFIATSILYTFFLVFLTLFISLITNYLQNRVLLTKIDERSIEILFGINNTKISDLKVGDYIRFECEGKVLNCEANWIVADITTSGDNKTYYFISDVSAPLLTPRYRGVSDSIEKIHSLTPATYEDIMAVDGYNKDIAKGRSNFKVQMVTSSLLERTRSKLSSSTETLSQLSAIFNTNGNYLVHVDSSLSAFNRNPYPYYELRKYYFDENTNESLIRSYCGVTIDTICNSGGAGGCNKIVMPYVDSNFGYAHLERNQDEEYVRYCYYASPTPYTHRATDKIVSFDESKPNDMITSNLSNLYLFRLMAEKTVKDTDTDTYLAGGNGTSIDPYIFLDGRKR